jgi:hypothetical protein
MMVEGWELDIECFIVFSALRLRLGLAELPALRCSCQSALMSVNKRLISSRHGVDALPIVRYLDCGFPWQP